MQFLCQVVAGYVGTKNNNIEFMCSYRCEYNSFSPEISNQISEIHNFGICIISIEMSNLLKKCVGGGKPAFKMNRNHASIEVDGSWIS